MYFKTNQKIPSGKSAVLRWFLEIFGWVGSTRNHQGDHRCMGLRFLLPMIFLAFYTMSGQRQWLYEWVSKIVLITFTGTLPAKQHKTTLL